MIPAAHPTRPVVAGVLPRGRGKPTILSTPRRVAGNPIRRDLTGVVPGIVAAGLEVALWCGLNRRELERLGLATPGVNPWSKRQ